jgi:hypothetical protein
MRRVQIHSTFISATVQAVNETSSRSWKERRNVSRRGDPGKRKMPWLDRAMKLVSVSIGLVKLGIDVIKLWKLML